MRLVLISILFVGLAVLLLGVKVLFVKGAKFPMGHHSHAVPKQKKINQSK